MEETKDQLTVYSLGIKARSKIEVYRLLTTEGGVYLPPVKEVNYQYMKSIIAGEKIVTDIYH